MANPCEPSCPPPNWRGTPEYTVETLTPPVCPTDVETPGGGGSNTDCIGYGWVAALRESDTLCITGVEVTVPVTLTSDDGATWSPVLVDDVPTQVTVCGLEYTATFTKGGCDGPCLTLSRTCGSGAETTYTGLRECGGCNYIVFAFSKYDLCPCDTVVGGPCYNVVSIKVEWCGTVATPCCADDNELPAVLYVEARSILSGDLWVPVFPIVYDAAGVYGPGWYGTSDPYPGCGPAPPYTAPMSFMFVCVSSGGPDPTYGFQLLAGLDTPGDCPLRQLATGAADCTAETLATGTIDDTVLCCLAPTGGTSFRVFQTAPGGIPGWDGPGFYCVRDACTADPCVAVELVADDRCNNSIEICSGPYDTIEDAEVACGPGPGEGDGCLGDCGYIWLQGNGRELPDRWSLYQTCFGVGCVCDPEPAEPGTFYGEVVYVPCNPG